MDEDTAIGIPVMRITSFAGLNCYLWINTEQGNDLSAGTDRSFHHTDDRLFRNYGPPLHRLIFSDT